MVDGGLIIGQPVLQKLQINGDLTMSRRGSTMIKAPSLISLHDKNMDILGGIADAPEEDKNEEKKSS